MSAREKEQYLEDLLFWLETGIDMTEIRKAAQEAQ